MLSHFSDSSLSPTKVRTLRQGGWEGFSGQGHMECLWDLCRSCKALFETLGIVPWGSNLTPTHRRLHSLKGQQGDRHPKTLFFFISWHLYTEWQLDERVSKRQLESQGCIKPYPLFFFFHSFYYHLATMASWFFFYSLSKNQPFEHSSFVKPRLIVI